MVLAYEMQSHKERVSKRSETCPLLVLMQECSTECCNQKGHNINRRIVRKMKSITFILCYLKKNQQNNLATPGYNLAQTQTAVLLYF